MNSNLTINSSPNEENDENDEIDFNSVINVQSYPGDTSLGSGGSRQKGTYTSRCGRYVYHIALIDYLQLYDISKKFERAYKILVLHLTSKSKNENASNLSVMDPK